MFLPFGLLIRDSSSCVCRRSGDEDHFLCEVREQRSSPVLQTDRCAPLGFLFLGFCVWLVGFFLLLSGPFHSWYILRRANAYCSTVLLSLVI